MKHELTKEELEQLLSEAVEIIDDYLNAGYKEARELAAKKAKEFYLKYHGFEYKNKDKR